MTGNDTNYVITDSGNGNWYINISMSNDDFWFVSLYDAADNLIDTVKGTFDNTNASFPDVRSEFTFKLLNPFFDNTKGSSFFYIS